MPTFVYVVVLLMVSVAGVLASRSFLGGDEGNPRHEAEGGDHDGVAVLAFRSPLDVLLDPSSAPRALGKIKGFFHSKTSSNSGIAPIYDGSTKVAQYFTSSVPCTCLQTL